MSLKAKIEAVIYASEEPVTLAQLVGLLGEEAQAELDRAVAQQTLALQEGELEAAEEADPALNAELEASGAEEAAEIAEPTHGDETAMNGAPGDEASAEPTHGDETAMNGAPESGAPNVGASEDGAAQAKAEKARAARLRAHFREVLDELLADYATPERGLEIREVGGGFRLATKPEYHDAVRGFVKSLKPPLKLTLPALETLAVVAYKQPVTAPEISEIRGVDSSGVLGSLIVRKLITTAGRKQVIGRPILYKTTKEFLLKFGLKDVSELPSIEEFEKMAGQMAEQEEMAMDEQIRNESALDEPAGTETIHTDYRVPEVPGAPEEFEAGAESYAPHQTESTPADDVVPEDRASIDGRLSSLPPRYDDAEDDPSAIEAEIQGDEQ